MSLHAPATAVRRSCRHPRPRPGWPTATPAPLLAGPGPEGLADRECSGTGAGAGDIPRQRGGGITSRVHGSHKRWRTPRTASITLNLRIIPWGLPSPLVRRMGRADPGALILANFQWFLWTFDLFFLFNLFYVWHILLTYHTYVTYPALVILMFLIVHVTYVICPAHYLSYLRFLSCTWFKDTDYSYKIKECVKVCGWIRWWGYCFGLILACFNFALFLHWLPAGHLRPPGLNLFFDHEFHGQLVFCYSIMNSMVNLFHDSEFHSQWSQFVFWSWIPWSVCFLLLNREFHGQFVPWSWIPWSVLISVPLQWIPWSMIGWRSQVYDVHPFI